MVVPEGAGQGDGQWQSGKLSIWGKKGKKNGKEFRMRARPLESGVKWS